MLIKKPPNISIKTLFLPWSVNLPQKCIDTNKINITPKPKSMYFGIKSLNLFS